MAILDGTVDKIVLEQREMIIKTIKKLGKMKIAADGIEKEMIENIEKKLGSV